MAGFPPYVYQAMLRAEGKQENEVYRYLDDARAAGVALQHDVEILGVVPAALPRRANHMRAQLLIQATIAQSPAAVSARLATVTGCAARAKTALFTGR